MTSNYLPADVREELDYYEEQIHKYRAGEVNETKMQKLRLTFGTYAQRQEGVQMQRIKIPGGCMNADQLALLGDAADRFGSGFLHFTTREDAQIYYVKLEQSPDLMRFLAAGGMTTREACGKRSAQYHRLLSRRHVSDGSFRCFTVCRCFISLSGTQ